MLILNWRLVIKALLVPFWHIAPKLALPLSLDKFGRNWDVGFDVTTGKLLNLKYQTFAAVRWTTAAMVGRTILQFLQVAILARVLTPADFGLMAVAMAVMAFLQIFTDLGVSNAIIHHQEISGDQLSSLYWLNVVVGGVLTFALILLSNSIGILIFNQPDLVPLLIVMSFSFLFTAVGQQLRVMAEKTLRFAVLAKIEFAAAVFGFVVAIGWAWIAPSIYALVAGMLVNSLVQSVLLWIYASNGWRPALRLRLGETRRFLKFGGYMLGNNLINGVNVQADVFIAGRVFPAATLGTYSLPRNLSLTVAGLVNPVVTRVGLPIMARVQNDMGFLRAVYLKTMRMTASINFPIYAALAMFSYETVLLVFGQKWTESAPLLIFLAIWGMFRSCVNPVGSLLFAKGRADLSFKWNLALLLVVAPVLWVSSHWGISGLAAGQAVLMAAILIPAWYFLVRPLCGAGLAEYVLTLLSPLVCAMIAVGLGYWGVSLLTSPLWRMVGAACIAVPAYLIMSYFFNRSWLSAMSELIWKR